MKTISGALLTLLATRNFYQADLYEFTLADGVTVLRYTDGDQNITVSGNTFLSGTQNVGPFFNREGSRGRISAKLGLDVDTLEFDVIPGSSTILGIGFNAAAQSGLFDGAKMTLYRAFMPITAYGDTSAGVITAFAGLVGAVKPGSKIHFTVNSMTILLNTLLPRNTYSTTCINVLGDTACTVSLPTFTITGTVTGGNAASVVATMASSKIVDYYALGRLIVLSGTYAGQSRTVKSSGTGTSVTFALSVPLPAPLAIGTSIKVIAGCNKKLGDVNGCLKFSNQTNFRGHPYVPQPETAA